MSLDVYLTAVRRTTVYERNITHNLGRMANEAGIYYHLWHPERIGITHAAELIPAITRAWAEMKANPDHFKQFNAPNGWGMYHHFIPWIEDYLAACIENPDAEVSTGT